VSRSKLQRESDLAAAQGWLLATSLPAQRANKYSENPSCVKLAQLGMDAS